MALSSYDTSGEKNAPGIDICSPNTTSDGEVPKLLIAVRIASNAEGRTRSQSVTRLTNVLSMFFIVE